MGICHGGCSKIQVLDERLTLLEKIKKTAHSHNSSKLWIHRMNWFSCIINTLNESSTLAGWKAPRKGIANAINFGPLFVLKLTTHSFCFMKRKSILVINHNLLNFQSYIWRRLNLSNGRFGRTLFQGIFTSL